MMDKTKKKTIKEIAKKYSLELILIFGSRASGKNYQGSDFDVAYLSKKELDLEKEARLILDLTPVFKSENIDLTKQIHQLELENERLKNNSTVIEPQDKNAL